MKQGQIHDHCVQDRRHRLSIFLAAVIGLFFVLALTSEVWARSSGGRYGGRSGFSSSRRGSSGDWAGSRSAPSTPYRGPTSPGYSPPIGGPGFSFFPFLLPFLFGWGGGAGGGGFGFGGLFSILIILGIVVLVGRVLLQNLATAWRNRLDRTSMSPLSPLGSGRYAVVKCQLALLSTARDLQRDLRQYALAATTDTVAGLATSLQEVVIALIRYRDYWRYGVIQVEHTGMLDDAERVFNRVVGQERAKLSEELTVNIEGVRRQASAPDTPTSDEIGRYLVVTLVLATGYPEFLANQTPSVKDVEATLQRLGTLLAADILALEIMWSPENPGDTLSEDELLTEYPELSPL